MNISSLTKDYKMISQKDLKHCLHYNPDTGIFRWKIKPNKRIYNWSIAGCRRSDGYVVIQLEDTYQLAHRLAFVYMTGKFPKEYTDHIDHVRHNNKWKNLREVSTQENSKNKLKPRNNKSGVVGVHLDKKRNKWRAQIRVLDNQIDLGSFKNKDDAIAAREAANIKYGFHENHGQLL